MNYLWKVELLLNLYFKANCDVFKMGYFAKVTLAIEIEEKCIWKSRSEKLR